MTKYETFFCTKHPHATAPGPPCPLCVEEAKPTQVLIKNDSNDLDWVRATYMMQYHAAAVKGYISLVKIVIRDEREEVTEKIKYHKQDIERLDSITSKWDKPTS